MATELYPVNAWFVGGNELRAYTSYPVCRKRQIERDGESRVRLEKPISIIVEYSNGTRKKLTIRVGYSSDGSSKPWFAILFFGPRIGGIDEAPALFHDIVCEARFMSARHAGLMYRYLLRRVGMSWIKRKWQWRAVRNLCQPIQDRYPEEVVRFARDHLEIEAVS